MPTSQNKRLRSAYLVHREIESPQYEEGECAPHSSKDHHGKSEESSQCTGELHG